MTNTSVPQPPMEAQPPKTAKTNDNGCLFMFLFVVAGSGRSDLHSRNQRQVLPRQNDAGRTVFGRPAR